MSETWTSHVRLSALQVRQMRPYALQHSLVVAIERCEMQARDMGIENPQVSVLFLTEFIIPEGERS